MWYGAIDPGKNGGWAVYDKSRLIEARGLVDTTLPYLFGFLNDCDEILIERAQAAPGQGASSTFEYGRNFGKVEAAALLTNAKVYYCAPAWWKSKLALSSDKALSIEEARKIPGANEYVTLKKHEGVAEAILIGQMLVNPKWRDELIKNNLERSKPKRKLVQYRL